MVIFLSVIILSEKKILNIGVPEFISTFFLDNLFDLVHIVYMLQILSSAPFICFNSPILNERLPFPEDSSHPPLYS